MNKTINQFPFVKGAWVRYNQYEAPIQFVCEYYITICIRPEEDKFKQTCILIYSDDWDKVKLINTD